MKKIFLVFLVYFTFYSNVFAASFDCSKASTDVEKLICSNSDLSSIDDDVSLLYSQANKLLSDKDSLKKEQIRWIKETRTCGLDYSCIYEKYSERKKQLFSLISSAAIQNQSGSTPPQTINNDADIDKQFSKDALTIDATLQVVKSCFQSKDYQCAKQKLDQLLTVYPENKLAKVGLLNITMAECIDRKDYSCALDAVNKWAILTPDDARALDAKVKLERALSNTTVSNPSENLAPDAQINITDKEIKEKYEVQLAQARLENKILAEKVESQKIINELHSEINESNQEIALGNKLKTQDLGDVQEKSIAKTASTRIPFESDKVSTHGSQVAQVNPANTEISGQTLDNSYQFSIKAVVIAALFGGLLVYWLLKPRSNKHKNNQKPNDSYSNHLISEQCDELIADDYKKTSLHNESDSIPLSETKTVLDIGYITLNCQGSLDDSTTIGKKMINNFNGNNSDNFTVINLKLGYTQGELSEDFEDFEDSFNAPNHVYWKFTILQDITGELDCSYLLIDWKNAEEYPLSSDEEVAQKIGEICSATSEEMFGSVIVLGAFESVVISGMDDPGYECVDDILEHIGGSIEVDDGIQIPEENVNSLFCLYQEIQEGIVNISNGSMSVNEQGFDIDGDYEVVSKVAYFTEDVMNY